jgi:hypothetical protein
MDIPTFVPPDEPGLGFELRQLVPRDPGRSDANDGAGLPSPRGGKAPSVTPAETRQKNTTNQSNSSQISIFGLSTWKTVLFSSSKTDFDPLTVMLQSKIERKEGYESYQKKFHSRVDYSWVRSDLQMNLQLTLKMAFWLTRCPFSRNTTRVNGT